MRLLIDVEKLNVFHNMFEKMVKRYPDGRNGMHVETSLEITDGRLVLHYNRLAKKYGHMVVEGDLLTEYILQAHSAIELFEVKDEDELEAWRGIASKTNPLQENRLIKYMKTSIEHRVYEFANPSIVRGSKVVNGETIYYRLKMDTESLDNLLHENPDDVEPIQLDNGNRLFGEEEHEYYISFFQKWYQENRESILTKNQRKLLDDLKTVAQDRELTRETFEEATGVSWNNYRDRLRRIEDRIEKAWRKQNPMHQSRRSITTTNRDRYVMELMELIDNPDNYTTQNIQITDKLVEGMKDRHTEELVFKLSNDAWAGEELILFNRIVKSDNSKRIAIKAPMLSKIIELIRSEAETLIPNTGTQYDIDNKKDIEDNYSMLEGSKKETREETIRVYDKEGNLLQVDTIEVEEDTKANNIFNVLPDGTWSKVE